jgi:hypothetical protein
LWSQKVGGGLRCGQIIQKLRPALAKEVPSLSQPMTTWPPNCPTRLHLGLLTSS